MAEMCLHEKCPISFHIFIVTLTTLVGIWLTAQWIDSLFRPNQYAHTFLMRQMDFRDPGWQPRCGITTDRRSKRGREFTIFAIREYVERGPEGNNPKPFDFEIPGLTVHLSPFGIGCGPTATVTTYGFIIATPVWVMGLGAWTYPVFSMIRGPLRRLRRRRRGLCVKCGYNLTGAPQPRCPECGTASPAKFNDLTPQPP